MTKRTLEIVCPSDRLSVCLSVSCLFCYFLFDVHRKHIGTSLLGAGFILPVDQYVPVRTSRTYATLVRYSIYTIAASLAAKSDIY